ncbi:enoyl-CoA hydratase [Altericroceibacterium spongiae]|uniref:Enoyl-CoA hydratase n=1 Tax=Altericroceibacterium spongiae TaxID=2320269 RepID=A0A420ERE4_9SPHN|nr:crotonase/enoyl-CoA hydratase family protein [Altericroceibacterium spongiae]RKF23247.1 enoyl-CoA hydratase [Altericroceibacterium spongiae]
MDQLAGRLNRTEVQETNSSDSSSIGFGDREDYFVEDSEKHLSIDKELFNLKELEVLYESRTQALWTYMCPEGRPSFTPNMLHDFEYWQRLICDSFGPGKVPLRYLILGSRSPGVFCFGGDLYLFQKLIKQRNREALVHYGHRCVQILHRNMKALDLPILTVGLVEGAALGGGFEALMSFDHIIAERTATFGLPEVLFGLFPGMGAHAFLTRKLGAAAADRMITSNRTYTAEDLYDLGLIHQIAEPGEGLETCRDFIARSDRRHIGLVNARRAARLASPLHVSELERITEIWADTALELSDQDLKIMNRLTRAQDRVAANAA